MSHPLLMAAGLPTAAAPEAFAYSYSGTYTASEVTIGGVVHVLLTLTSGGTFAIAGAVQRMVRHVAERCGQPPLCVMTGGAGWKMAPYMETPFELVEGLIFEGLLAMAAANDPVASQQRVTAL